MKKIVISWLVLSLFLFPLALSAAASEPIQGGTFRYGLTVNPRGMFNPILATEQYDTMINDVVYDRLLYIDENLEPQPQLAERWEISEDGLSITFYLKQGVLFHDGVEMTARDVEYTYKTMLHPRYTGVRFGNFRVLDGAEEYRDGERDDVPGIEVIDDYTIRFSTNQPHAPLLVQFIYGILPSHLYRDIPIGELEQAAANRHPIGTGPFEFVEFRTDRHVMLDAFDDYHGGRPNIDQLVYQRVADDAMPIYLRQNRVDFVPIRPEQYPEVARMDDINLYIYEALSYSYIAFNLRQERLADTAVRQAMKAGFDRDTYVEIIMEGFAIKANAPVPQASWAFTGEGINSYEYDPELAAQMLADAGWAPGSDGILEKDGMRLQLDFLVPEGTRTTEQMALLFQQNMGDLGIQIDLTFMEFTAAVDRVDAREFDLFTMAWGLAVDPDPYPIWHSTSPWNDPGFEHARSDELIELGRATMAQSERAEIYREWQQVINQELPYIFLNYAVVIGAMNERVQGYDRDPGPLGPLVGRHLLREIWLPDGQ